MKIKKGCLARQRSLMNLFYIPALLLFLFFVIYPFFEGIRISFTRWNGYSQKFTYIGFENYLRFFQDSRVWLAAKNTFIYGFGSTLIQTIFGLAYALLVNSAIRGRNIVRTVVYMPVMIASLIMGYIIYFIVQYNNGALNDIMILFGRPPVDWMSDGRRAVFIITVINSFQYVGNNMILYLAGLQCIPITYYEAAIIDGASSIQKFRAITLPLLIPAMMSVVTLNVIGGLKMFDIIVALTGGGPGWASHSLSTLIANQYFKGQVAGYAATIGFFSFILIMFMSNLVIWFFSKKEIDV